MMNPQYPPPGQNNNAPSNPMFPPTSQDYNGVQNANIYNQMPPNGPPKPFDPSDMSNKMQNMNLNGPQGFPSIPTGQLPPGANFPPTSNYPGQSPIPQGPYPPGRPAVSGAPPQFPPPQKPMPPSSAPGPQFQMPPPSQTPDQNRQPMQGRPPNQMGPSSMGPSGPGSQPGQMLPSSQPGLPPQARIGSQQQPPNPNMPPQAGFQQPGMPSQGPGLGGMNQQGQPLPPHSMQSQMPGHPGLPPQPGQPGLPPQGLPPTSAQSRMPPQPGQPGMPTQFGQPGQMPSQPGQISQSGQMPSQPGQMPGQPGQILGQPGQMPDQPGQMPGQRLPPQPGMPPQRGMPGQPGLPPQPGMPPQPSMGHQPGMPSQLNLGQQPRMPPQPGMPQPGMASQPGLGHQPGMPPQSGMPPQPGMASQPGLPPQPGMPPQGMQQQPGMGHQPGLPPQPMPPQPGMGHQPGMPPHPGMPPQAGMPPSSQYNQMPGMPHMPPPMSPSQQYPGSAPQPGFQKPPGAYPGMPPMQGGMPPQSGYPPQYAQQPAFPGQQQKRLDPDQMPSPIQVMADDQANRGGVFVTNDKGLVPPLVTTDFTVDDKGNASPRYIRSSMYSVPVTQDLLKQTAMPFCLVISPMAETVGSEPSPPLLDFAALTGSPAMGPVRCSRCKAYMCPNMKFIDAGRHFKCAFCKATTEVPMEYTQYVNSMQQYSRVPAEMALGTYEIVATKEYCRNNTLPNPPAIVFVIDVSYNSIKSGLLHTLCDNIMHIIESMPRDEQTGKSWTRVGFITYSSTVHFYNIKGTLAQPQMLSVGDVGDMFVPLLEGFLQLPEDSGAVLQQLLQQLPTIFQDNKETETILLPAVQAGYEALKAADTSGQLLVFHTSLPSFPAPGKLINREDRKLLGTDKEKAILTPQTTAYNELGQSCSAAGVSVELFVCNNSYVDAATIGQLPRLTGGHIHKYTYFSAETDGPRLVSDSARVASRDTAHDAVMRVRTSTGVRATDFYGHFFMSNTTDVELAAIDADKAIGIEIKHDDKLTAEDGVYIQAALLYTHRSGQRRLRVLNLALAVAHQLADVYRSMELDTTINFLTKQAVWALREHPSRQIREGLSVRCAKSLAAYRRHCASPSSAGQLVLPESMKLLPLYTSCMLRSDALAGGPDITCDDRSCAMYRALAADVSTSVVYTYPRLLPLHRLAPSPSPAAPPSTSPSPSPSPAAPAAAPAPLRASIDKMTEHGVYLLENGVHMLIWVGGAAPPEFVQDVFGVAAPHLIDTQVCELPERDNPTSHAVRQIVEDARRLRRTAMRLEVVMLYAARETEFRRLLVEDRGRDATTSYMDFLLDTHKAVQAMLCFPVEELTVMRQHDKLEAVLRHFLVEDRGVDGAASYVDYLCHVHKEIRALL